jgi:hypothetical protein
MAIVLESFTGEQLQQRPGSTLLLNLVPPVVVVLLL